MSHVTLFDEAGVTAERYAKAPPSPRESIRETGTVDLDRLVWDPEYRTEIQRALRPSRPRGAANDDSPPPRPVRTVA